MGYSNLPPLAVFLGDVLVGLRVIGHFHLLGIPVDLHTSAHGHLAQEDDFGDWACFLEMGKGRGATSAGGKPVIVMALVPVLAGAKELWDFQVLGPAPTFSRCRLRCNG